MKFLLVFSFSVFLFLNAESQTSVKVMTYNIRWDNPDDGEDNWHNRKEALSSFIAGEKPDFIGLQEALEGQLEYLKNYSGSYNHIGVGRDDGIAEGEFSPVLFDSSKWELIEFQNKWLSTTPDSVSRGWDAACNRVVSQGIFKNKESGEEVLIMNTHFDHVGEMARKGSAELIINWVKDNEDIKDIILLGDFNFNPTNPLYKILTSELNDSRKKTANIYEDNIGTFNGFKLDGPFTNRIDFVFTKKDMNIVSYQNIEIRVNGRQISDHFPIIVDIKI